MRRLYGGPLLATLMLAAMPVSAQTTAEAGGPAAEAGLPFATAAIAPTELATVTGRADTAQQIRAQNTSTVSNNTVSGQSQTGTISFDPNAFQGVAGLSLVSANTGNNVSINSSLNVNVAIQR
jgi:hypothetical protein